MLKHSVVALAALALIGTTQSTAVLAQSPDGELARETLQLTPYAGVAIFGDYLNGPLGTSLTSTTGPVYGFQLGVVLSDNLSLIGNLAHSSADLEVGIPILGGIAIGSSSVWMYDAGVQFGAPLPLSGRIPVSPFVQVGAGAVHHDVSSGPLEFKATNFAANVGLGADLRFSKTVGLTLLARDYIGKFDFREATGIDVDSDVSHNWAFSAGVRFGF